MLEEEKLMHLETVDKVREKGGTKMIISEILCLFAYIACPLFLLPLVWWVQPQIDKYPTKYVI